MSSHPRISVVTGYYNRKENLSESINSILDQTFADFEFIIVDDCSTDGTYESLKEFEDSRIKLIRNSNNIGFTKSLIKAINQCQGDFIAIHGAGDISMPTRLETQLHFLIKNTNIVIVGCLLENVYDNKVEIHNPGTDLLYTHGEVMYRKSTYDLTPGYRSFLELGQFTNLKIELLKYGGGSYVNEVLYRRYHFENGVTKNPSKIVDQQLFMALGYELANKRSWMHINISKIVLRICIKNVEILNKRQKCLLGLHLKSNKHFIVIFLYKLYERDLLSMILFKKISNRLIL